MPASPPSTIFDHSLDFDPSADVDAFARQAPAKWVVYLLADAEGRPVQLLCVKNLRYSLKRRLGGDDPSAIGAAPSKRVNYREIVRQVHWRRVDSAFEADWLYYEAARALFPDTYPGMVGFRPAWFIHVNPDAPFPRYTKTISLLSKTGLFLGPLEDKHAAARLVHLAEDAFDLCRYYPILVESPNAKACAYKEMGKCPAPCDGSVSMEQYRGLVQWSARTLIDPADAVREHKIRMQQAAAELRFEIAAKIKQYIDQLSQLAKGAFRHVRALDDFRFLSLQHGPRDGTAKVFLVTPGRIQEIAGLVTEPAPGGDLLRLALEISADPRTSANHLDAPGAERIGIVAHHLFSAKHRGVFLPLQDLDDRSLAKAFRDLGKQAPAEETEGEGVLKELQSL